MAEVTSGLPLQLARIDLTCEGEEDLQFTAKILLDNEGFSTQTMEELIRDVYHDVYPNGGEAVVKVSHVSSDYIDTPDNPLIQVPIHLLRDTALDYAVAEGLEWSFNDGEGVRELTFRDGIVFAVNEHGTPFRPSRSNSICAFFIGKHELNIEWDYPGGNGATTGNTKKLPRVGETRLMGFPHGIAGQTLPEAVARYMVQSVTPRPYVAIPYSLIPELASK